MIHSREGSTLHLTDSGIYEPPPIPRRFYRRRSWARAWFTVLALIAISIGVLAALSQVQP